MRRHGENVAKNANLIKRRAALAIDAAVVISTPVDTGRARSNWQANLGGPADGTLEAYAPGTAGSTGAANTSAALDQAKAVIAGSRPQEAIHITNNLPYIGRLNDGHSAQAPAGFVEVAVLVGVNAVVSAPPIVTGKHDGF
jgi:hypothetical protein